MLHLISQAAKSALLTTGRRALKGARRASWPLLYEAQIELVRQQNIAPHPSLEVRRRDFDRIAAKELLQRRVSLHPIRSDGVTACWVEPKTRARQGVLMYLHGGSYIMGSTYSHLPLLAWMACRWNVRILSVEYRLAPEHPCPAAIEDAQRAYLWLAERAEGPLWLAGDSAGGGLSLALMAGLRDGGHPQPQAALLLSPWTDLTLSRLPPEDPPPYDYLTHAQLAQAAAMYAGELSRDDPRVSPLYAALHDLPPLYVLVGGVELLLRDGVDLAEKAQSAGVDVVLDVVEDEIHVFPAFGPSSPAAPEAIERMGTFLFG